MKPIRIQLSREAGFDLQATSIALNGLPAVNVARPSKWGNPYLIGEDGTREQCVQMFKRWLMAHPKDTSELRDRNLACWCAFDGQPCHADVLLEIANSRPTRTITVRCKRCKKLMTLEADESAGQDTIDALANMATCDACAEELGLLKRKQQRFIDPADVPKPYKDL